MAESRTEETDERKPLTAEDLRDDNSSLSKFLNFARSRKGGRDELLSTLSRIEMVAKLLTSEGAESTLNAQKDGASPVEMASIEAKLDSIDRINKFRKSEAKEIIEKVYNNEEVTKEESSALVEAISSLGDDIKMLESSELISRESWHSAQINQIGNRNTGYGRRGDIASRFLMDINSTSGMKNSRSLERLKSVLRLTGMSDEGLTQLLNSDNGKKIMAKRVNSNSEEVEIAMEAVVRELEELKVINSRVETSSEMLDLDASAPELIDSLKDLGNRLDKMPQFFKDTKELHTIIEESEASGEVDRVKLNELLTRLDTDTTPAKTLYSLRKMNGQMDDMLVSQESIENSVSKGVLGSFKEKAEDFTGSELIKDGILGMIAGSVGINPVVVEGAMDMLTSAGSGALGYMAGRRGGRDATRGGRRGGRAGRGGRGLVGTSMAKMKGLTEVLNMKTLGKFLGKSLKFVPVIGTIVQGAMSIFDAFEGWDNASSITGKSEEALTTMDRVKAASASVMSGLTLGLVDVQTAFGMVDKAWNWITGWWDKITTFMSDLGGKLEEALKTLMEELWNKVTEFIPDSIKNLSDFEVPGLSDLSEKVSDKVEEVSTSVKESASEAWNEVTDASSRAYNFISNSFFGDDEDTEFPKRQVSKSTSEYLKKNLESDSSSSKVYNDRIAHLDTKSKLAQYAVVNQRLSGSDLSVFLKSISEDDLSKHKGKSVSELYDMYRSEAESVDKTFSSVSKTTDPVKLRADLTKHALKKNLDREELFKFREVLNRSDFSDIEGKSLNSIFKEVAVEAGLERFNSSSTDSVESSTDKMKTLLLDKNSSSFEREFSLMSHAAESGITGENLANFMGQMAHESGNFMDKDLTENYNGDPREYFKKYDGRKDLGNLNPGDGFKYRGRGYIQLTGKANYEKYGELLGIDLVNNPDLAADPNVASAIAIQYWKENDLNGKSVKQATRIINGGYNGLDDREVKTDKYREMMDSKSMTLASENKHIESNVNSSVKGVEAEAMKKVMDSQRGEKGPSIARTSTTPKVVQLPGNTATPVSSTPSSELMMIGAASIFS
ncbi:putative glycoside hydrolase [Vibrio phage Va2]|nr:putative glycoside hydrolase [Vibrio phage Va2]